LDENELYESLFYDIFYSDQFY
jgi:hypothetical protein